MKRLLLLFIVLICFVKSNAQNRYMYLAISADSTIFLVDTLPNDNKQFANYQFHNNVFLIWVKTVKKDDVNNESFTGSLSHFAIDTANTQMAVVSYVNYKNGSIINSGNANIQWTDIVPGSIGDTFVNYCKYIHGPFTKIGLVLNAEEFEVGHPWIKKFSE